MDAESTQSIVSLILINGIMKIEKEVIQEWKRFMESPEYNHDPECGTLLIAQHFAEWGRRSAFGVARETSDALTQGV